MKFPDELKFIENSLKIQKTTTARLDGKVCVISGATSGVGYETAKQFAKGGAKLVIVCRNEEKAQSLKSELKNNFGCQVDIILADFSDLHQVKQAAESIVRNYPHIDVLINSVGIFNKRRRLSKDGLEMVFLVNHLATFLFTKLLFEKMRLNPPARIILVNSEGHRFGGLYLKDLNWRKRPYIGLLGYGAAKVAQLLTMLEFADMQKNSGTTINAVHPGAVRTNIGMNNGILYRLYNQYILYWFLKDPIIAGEAIYYLAAAPELETVCGKFFNLTHEEIPAVHARNRSNGKEVWKISENIINKILKEKVF